MLGRIAWTVGLCACLVACGGSNDQPADLGGGDAGFDGGADATADGADTGPGFDINDDVADAPPLGCSADLRSVTDASGAVIKTCPPDQGCSKGVCVEACAAASASKGNVGCDFR